MTDALTVLRTLPEGGCVAAESPDPVNHPEHYRGEGLEAIQVIEAFHLDYHLGNAVKYILRAERKGKTAEDLRKAVWYLNRKLERLP